MPIQESCLNHRTHVVLVIAALLAGPALADQPGRHPAYIHALADLRTAAYEIDRRRPEDGAVSRDEGFIRDQINAAMSDLRYAAGEDGKRMDPWVRPDVGGLDPGRRLHDTVDLLRQVQADVARPEDDPRAVPLQQSALEHVDAALRAARRAMDEIERRDRSHG